MKLKKSIVIPLFLVVVTIAWTYIWYASARRYVHAELANQFIEYRTKEHSVVLKAIEDLETGDLSRSQERLEILSDIYRDELIDLERSLAADAGIIESLVISTENMERIRQFVKKYSFTFELNYSEENH